MQKFVHQQYATHGVEVMLVSPNVDGSFVEVFPDALKSTQPKGCRCSAAMIYWQPTRHQLKPELVSACVLLRRAALKGHYDVP